MNRRSLLLGVAATFGGAPTVHAQRARPPIVIGRMWSGELLACRAEREGDRRFDDEDDLPLAPSGRVFFAAAHDAPGRHVLVLGDRSRSSLITLASRTHTESRVRVPDVEDLRSHDEARVEISRARRRVGRRAHFERGFAWPIDAAVTSEFAAHRPHGVHLGIDLVAASGTRVRAPADGVVVMHVETPVFGRTVVIDHGHGLTSALLHLSRALAPEGALVRRGDVIALTGATGRVTGPHLDWRVAWRDVDVDPRGVLALLPARP